MYHTSFTIWWSMNKMIILEWLTKFILIFYTLYYLNTFETAHMTGVLLLGKVPQMSRISVPRSSSELDPCNRQWLCVKGYRSHSLGHVDFLQAFQLPPASLMTLRYQPWTFGHCKMRRGIFFWCEAWQNILIHIWTSSLRL